MPLWWSCLAGAATFLGALVVAVGGAPGRRTLAFVLGLAAGVMGGVVGADLLPAALTCAGPAAAAAGLLAGVAILAWGDARLRRHLGPRRHTLLKTGILIGAAIALHDLPEGLAIAAGFAALPRLGSVLALAIGLHNVPEGMATAAPLLAAGVRRRYALAACAALSLVTPLGTAVGLLLTRISPVWIAGLAAAAAGAMLYIVVAELIPRAVGHHFKAACGGLLTGLGIVYLLARL
ncbi:MAG: ZIP family metal transporter [Bacillota bacterium]